jgi:hypothetical protein
VYDNLGQAKNQKEVDAILKKKTGSMTVGPLSPSAVGGGAAQMMT